MVASLTVSLIAILYPILTRKMLNEFIPEGKYDLVVFGGIGLLTLYIVRMLLNYWIQYYGHVMGVKMQAQMRTELFTHLEKLPYSYFDNHETGKIMTRMTSDLWEISELAHHGPENVLISTVSAITSFIFLSTINIYLTLIIFVAVPFLLFAAMKLRVKMRQAFKESREAVGKINACVEGSISGIRTTKAYNNSEKELEKARQKASSMVASAKASSDFILEQMDKVRKAKDSERLGSELDSARRAVREHLRENSSKFDPVEQPKRDENYVLPRKLKRGDEVTIMTLGTDATLLEEPDKSGNVRVQAGILQTRVNIKDLRLKENTVTVTSGDKKVKASTYSVSRATSFKDEIDLRGMTGDEAWLAVDKYFDEATLANVRTVRLIHGKGTGALKAALWKFLKGDKRISTFRIGQWGEGDGGVTVVELK